MKNIFLITKLKTTNIGNEALSNEIISLFTSFSKGDHLNVNGRPFGLDGYYPKRIITKKDPVEVLDRWADKIVARINKEPGITFTSSIPKVFLFKKDPTLFKNDDLKAKFRPLKRILVSLLPYTRQYTQRARLLKNADWLIYSGAGEVGDNIVFLRQLVELRVAQKLGIKTAAVNQSVVIKTDIFKKLVGHVYGNMKKIVIRGTITRDNLVSYGIDTSIIDLAPDSAINASFTNKVAKAGNLVALNLTPRISISEKEIEKIVSHIQSLGKKIIFVTNEPHEDNNMVKLFAEKFRFEVYDTFDNYQDYMTKLASCDFVVSTRLHTNILTLATGTPIVPIEGNVFKTTELLNELHYPINVLNSKDTGWIQNLLGEIDKVNTGKYDFHHYFNEVLPIHKKRAAGNASWINDQN